MNKFHICDRKLWIHFTFLRSGLHCTFVTGRSCMRTLYMITEGCGYTSPFRTEEHLHILHLWQVIDTFAIEDGRSWMHFILMTEGHFTFMTESTQDHGETTIYLSRILSAFMTEGGRHTFMTNRICAATWQEDSPCFGKSCAEENNRRMATICTHHIVHT